MKTEFVYPDVVLYNEDADVIPGGTIGEMVRTAFTTGITPDMPTAELGYDEDETFGDRPFVDPYGDIRTDWAEMAEKGLPRGVLPAPDGFSALTDQTPADPAPADPTPAPADPAPAPAPTE